MIKLRQKAKELLESGEVKLVIGYEKGNSSPSRPVFITKSEDAEKLIWDDSCHYNLAVYLPKHEVKKFGKIAVVAPINVLKGIVLLAGEHQIKESNIVALGVVKGSDEVIDLPDFQHIEQYVNTHPLEMKPKEKELMEKLEAMSIDERWNFWQEEFSKCFKCYACRAACPMCYCHQCTVDCNQPQWIKVGSHDHGNYEWHMMRAFHLAGRCMDCGACADACPMDIPLNLLTLKLSDSIYKDFGFKAASSVAQTYVLSDFKVDDKENFIW